MGAQQEQRSIIMEYQRGEKPHTHTTLARLRPRSWPTHCSANSTTAPRKRGSVLQRAVTQGCTSVSTTWQGRVRGPSPSEPQGEEKVEAEESGRQKSEGSSANKIVPFTLMSRRGPMARGTSKSGGYTHKSVIETISYTHSHVATTQ